MREATRRTLARLAAGEAQVAALSSTLAEADEVPAGVVALSATYPMSRYFAAFDGAVAAAGYNAYHELIALGVPALFVPMPRDTDDQPARARYAERAGIGLGVTGPADPELESKLERMLDPAERGAIRHRLGALGPAEGAAQAAAWLATPRLALRAKAPHRKAPLAGGPKDFRRRWGSFFASLPDTAVRLTRQQLTQPRARALVFAVGVPADDVVDAVGAAIAEAGQPPERTLVVTDALGQLGALRALGAGVEHVPTRGSRQAELAGGTYDEFVRAAARVDPGRAPADAGGGRGPGWNADPFGTLRALRWRPKPP